MVSRLGILTLSLGLCFATAVRAGQATVLDVAGDVELSPGGDDTQAYPLKGGETVNENDRIVTAMDSQARLKFGDNSVVVVGELTDLKVAAFRDAGTLVQTRLWLRGGQVASAVNKSSERPSDFAVKTPTATAGVRGTEQVVFTADGRTRVGILSGMGYGLDMFGTEVKVSRDEEARTDDEGRFDTPDEVANERARTDGSADRKSYDEEEAYDESEILYVQSPGLYSTAGENTAGDPTLQDASQGIEQLAMGIGRAQIIQDSDFDQPLNVGPWQDASFAGGSALISGSQLIASTDNNGEVGGAYQLVNFAAGGSYDLSVDLDLVFVDPMAASHNVHIGFFADSGGTIPGTANIGGGGHVKSINYTPGTNSPNILITDTVSVSGPVSEYLFVHFENTGGGTPSASSSLVVDHVELTGP